MLLREIYEKGEGKIGEKQKMTKGVRFKHAFKIKILVILQMKVEPL